jgi:DNA-binding PadR family transcriptional regulator
MSTEDLREPTLLLLTALTSGPRHGYALIEAVAELSGGRVRLKPGSLYATLDRLAREGLVTEAGTEVVAGRHRRYYELSDAGAEVLSAQVGRLQSITAAAAEGLRRRRAVRRSGAPGELGLAGGAA